MEARNPEENVLIMPNDVISVPRAEMIYVIGGGERSGGFVLHQKENVTVLQALALAGGLTRTAAKKNAKILRPAEGDAERTEITINLKDIMAGRSQDVVLARISDLAPLTARVYTLTRRSGTISPPERGGG